MLQIVNLQRHFDVAGRTVKAVDGVSFTLAEGSFVSVIGKSGSGKSTLLALLGALDKPTSGRILLGKEDLEAFDDEALRAFRLRRVGFVFQNYQLIPNLSALENVSLPLEFASVDSKTRRSHATSLLERVGLPPDRHGHRPGRLSGGEQQRVAIARALANSPKMLLADEPTGNLDGDTGRRIIELLRSLAHDYGVSVLVVTHDPSMADETDFSYEMQDGKFIATHNRRGARAVPPSTSKK